MNTQDALHNAPERRGRRLMEIERRADIAPKLAEALRCIRRQSVAPDWTHEQAFNFMRETARAALAEWDAQS